METKRDSKPIERGQIIEVAIEDFTDMGQGIGRHEGMAIFVEGVFPGDVAKARLTKVKKNYALSKCTEILSRSKYRIDKKCKYSVPETGGQGFDCNREASCGGCIFDGYAYEGQLKIKEKQVRDKLIRIAGIEEPKIAPIIAMEEPYRYRNKAQMPISKEGKVGFFKGKSHEVVDCKDCMLQSPVASAVASAMRQFMNETKVPGFDRETSKGLLRHVVTKTALATGEVMVIIVATSKEIPNLERLAQLLDEAIYDIPAAENGVEYSLESLIINVNKASDTKVLGEECIVVAGKRTICEEVMGMKFEISPLAFYQVNPVQMQKLYQKVVEYCELKGEENIFDLYCGVGTIGLFCAREMQRLVGEKYGEIDYSKLGTVYGIESVKGAVLDANRNAVINGIVNAKYILGKAEEKIGELIYSHTEKDGEEVEGISPNIVILDPPRAGCDIELLRAVAEAGPAKIIYVSCDPGTMARDIKILCEGNTARNGESENAGVNMDTNVPVADRCVYEFTEATPVDMFPWTGSIETVCLLTKKPDFGEKFCGELATNSCFFME